MNEQFTDTQRLNFIEKHKIEPRFCDLLGVGNIY